VEAFVDPPQSKSQTSAKPGRSAEAENAIKERYRSVKDASTIFGQKNVSLLKAKPMFSDEDLDEHMEAYRHARFYHATRPENAEKILKEGLKPSKRGQKRGAEASDLAAARKEEKRAMAEVQEAREAGHSSGSSRMRELMSELDSRNKRRHELEDKVEDAKKNPRVYLGGNVTMTKRYMAIIGAGGGQHLRAFLTPPELDDLRPDLADSNSPAFWREDRVRRRALIQGRLEEQDPKKLKKIFKIVQQHYPGGGRHVTPEEIMWRHAEAIARGRTQQRQGDVARTKPSKAVYEEDYLSD
jgi:hypothetical protein